MDFGERLSRRIQADVERQIEESFAGDALAAGKAGSKLALFGLLNLVLLAAAIAAIVLLVKLVV